MFKNNNYKCNIYEGAILKSKRNFHFLPAKQDDYALVLSLNEQKGMFTLYFFKENVVKNLLEIGLHKWWWENVA